MDVIIELRSIFFKLLSLMILTPVFAYGILLSIENLEKTWKTGSRKKKWFSITTLLLFLAIALGGLR